MSDDNLAGPSLLLAQHHAAQREHHSPSSSPAPSPSPTPAPPLLHAHRRHHYNHHHHNHGRAPLLDPRQDALAETTVTISIIKQINVDIYGNTLSINYIQTHLTPPSPTSAQLTEISLLPSSTSLPAVPVDSASPLIPPSISQASSTIAASGLTTSDFGAKSDPTPSPSLIAGSNSSSLPSNSTSLSYFNSSLSTQSYSNSSSRSSTLFKSSSSTTTLLPPTAIGGIPPAGTGATPVDGSENTQTASGGNASNENATPMPVVIGGVVGSLAGAAVLIFALLYLIRWRKRSRGMLSLGSGNDGDGGQGANTGQPTGTMTEQRSNAFAVPSTLAALTGYSKRFSQKSERTVSTTAGSERGFYRVSGRKLPSVLQTGGDGYGDEIHPGATLSGSSFYPGSDGRQSGGGPGSPPLPMSMRESAGGVPVMRPSPARTPTHEQSPFTFSAPGTPPLPPQRPDGLGRSHVSLDGSHASRFTEEV